MTDRERKEHIRLKEEEILFMDFICATVYAQPNQIVIAKRVLTGLVAALADLKRGMK